MKDLLLSLVKEYPQPVQARNRVREYLQARILAALQHSGAMLSLAFHGGTALRFLYSFNRFSEDLDFALERAPEHYDFRRYLKSIRTELAPEGYTVELKANDRKTVHSAFVRFPGLLYELGLSPHPNEVLAVKIEIDTNPPEGGQLETTVVRRFVIMQLQHYDKACLFAGKLHAILQRNYTKGRDLYDLLWYLSNPEWHPPNLEMLNNALEQTGWNGPILKDENWRQVVLQRLQTIDWENIVRDVRPFLESNNDAQLIKLATFEHLLRN